MDCSPRGSSVGGISQARILERVAISFSRGSSWPRDGAQVSCIAGRFFTTEPGGLSPNYLCKHRQTDFQTHPDVSHSLTQSTVHATCQPHKKAGKAGLHPSTSKLFYYNSQKVETIQVSIDGWMHEWNVFYMYNGILFSPKQKENSETWKNLEDIMLSEISWSKKDKY